MRSIAGLARGASRDETTMSTELTIKQVLCVKWGTLYGPEYVNRLYGMVARHLSGPFRLVCLTDDPRGLRDEVEPAPLPELGVPHPTGTMGKWRKVVLWGRELAGLWGRCCSSTSTR